MDLNELYFRHQVALMRAAFTRSHGERERQHLAADGFASRIGLIQRRGGALAAPLLAVSCAGAAA